MGDLVLKREYSEDGYAVPSDFLRDEHIFVFGDGDPLSPLEYDIANDGKGGRTLTTKDVFDEVCIAYVPRVDLTLTKLDQGSVTGLNDYFLRVEQAIQILRWQTGKSLGGGVCDMGAPDILRDLSDLKDVVAGLSEKVAELCADPAENDPEVGGIKVCTRLKQAEWDLDAEYCWPDWSVPPCVAKWPPEWPDCKDAIVCYAPWLKGMKADNWIDYCPPANSWTSGHVLYPDKPTFTLSDQWEHAA